MLNEMLLSSFVKVSYSRLLFAYIMFQIPKAEECNFDRKISFHRYDLIIDIGKAIIRKLNNCSFVIRKIYII